MHQEAFLSKQVRTIVTGRQHDTQMIEFPGAYTLLGKPSTASNTTWDEEAPCVAGAFLEKCASITVVDLVQRKKLHSWKFF